MSKKVWTHGRQFSPGEELLNRLFLVIPIDAVDSGDMVWLGHNGKAWEIGHCW